MAGTNTAGGTDVGRLERIWIKRFRRGPMDPVQQAELRAAQGLVGNADQGGKRQVTLISRGEWDRVSEAMADHLDPAIRRANVLISGIRLEGTRGRVLRIGSCRFRINGETRPCERMDEAAPGLRNVMRNPGWAGGAYAESLDDGAIALGDPVSWDDQQLE